MAVPEMPVGVARVAFSGRYGVSHWVNVMHLQVTGAAGADEDDMLGLAEAMHVAFNDNLHTLAPTASHLEHTKVLLQRGAGDIALGEWAQDFAGDTTGDDLPAQVARLISWRVGSSWRGGHARTYLAAATYDQLDGVTELSGTAIAAHTAGAAAFRTAVNAIDTENLSNVTLGMLSYFTAGGSTSTPPVYRDPPVFYAITSGSCQPRICTQRRRLGAEI